MKTLIAIISVIIFTGSIASAQTHNLGFYIGPNFSGFDVTSPNLTAEKRTGYDLGAYYRSGKFLYGQIGLEYVKLNSDLILSDSNGMSAGVVNLSRAQLPLYAGFNLLNPIKRVVNIRAYGGPVVTYKLGALVDNPDFSVASFSRLGVNGTVGGGLDILIFSLDAGYTFGLTDLFTHDFSGKGNYAFMNFGVKF